MKLLKLGIGINMDEILSQAVQSHLSIMQMTIQRMANSSSLAKTACITMVSAILVIITDKGNPNYILITLIPIMLFCILDTYYLALEKGFRNSYNIFIKKLHDSKMEVNDLYAIIPTGNKIILFFQSLMSFSIWPFYMLMLAMTLLVKKYLM